MRAGMLRHRITVQNASLTINEMGERDASFSDGLSCWARVVPMKETELQDANQTKARITHKISVRYRTDITPTSRIKFGSRIFEIVQVLNREELDEQMDIMALEMV
tara:strand:- start:1454 stop:1771 length:318 start_codon:yes stop_codon:yes gene_type:complete